MKVYGVVLSPYVRKVLAVCSIKGLEYEVDAGAFPKTTAYTQRVVAHPVLASILAAEQEMPGAIFAD